MKKIKFCLFPGGRNKCLTMSYDDGNPEDDRLAKLFRDYGIKCTFHINSGRYNFSDPAVVEEFRKCYEGHEISCHTVSHAFPTHQPNAAVLAEILEDKRALEKACGYPVRGMSYPFGDVNDRTVEIYRSAGMEYARTVSATNNFSIPTDFMRWDPTCHHGGDITKRFDEFHRDFHLDALGDYLEEDYMEQMKLFYIWGHSYEFREDNNWELIEEFCEKAHGHDDVWYATNIEIVEYMQALYALRFSADCDQVYNPTATDVWFKSFDKVICCPAGKTVSC